MWPSLRPKSSGPECSHLVHSEQTTVFPGAAVTLGFWEKKENLTGLCGEGGNSHILAVSREAVDIKRLHKAPEPNRITPQKQLLKKPSIKQKDKNIYSMFT